MNTQNQQGDVLFEQLNQLPKDLIEVLRPARGYVLAEGEVTGHAHRVQDEIRLYRDSDGQMYLKADKPFTVLHEEHKSIRFLPGIFRVWRVREYDHIKEISRRVAD